MAKYPLLFDPRDPYAHYDKAGKLYKRYASVLGFAYIMPMIALAAGTIGVFNVPSYLALNFLFGIAAVMLSVFGCKFYNQMLCFISAFASLVLAGILFSMGTAISYAGCAAHAVSAIVQFAAMPAVSGIIKLKDLPGFPLFDPSAENLSFFALDNLGAKGVIKSREQPAEKPKEHRAANTNRTASSMNKEAEETKAKKEAERNTADETVLRDEIPPEKNTYDKMMKVSNEHDDNFSDLDLFD